MVYISRRELRVARIFLTVLRQTKTLLPWVRHAPKSIRIKDEGIATISFVALLSLEGDKDPIILFIVGLSCISLPTKN